MSIKKKKKWIHRELFEHLIWIAQYLKEDSIDLGSGFIDKYCKDFILFVGQSILQIPGADRNISQFSLCEKTQKIEHGGI